MGTVASAEKEKSITSTTPRIKVEVTAWPGTAQEKRWSLLKPVTVIGAKRHAQIVVREEQVNRSHAAIINTGADVLLVDLLSDTGSYCNGRLVKTRVLKDGDVIRIGSAELRMSIELPPNPVVARRGMLSFSDPFTMPKAMRLLQVDTDQGWELTSSVAIIGSRANVHVRIEGEEIARAHSLVFATIHGIGIVDLGSSTPLKINGHEKKMAYLKRKDRLLIGKVGLLVEFPDEGRGSRRGAAAGGSRSESATSVGGADGGDSSTGHSGASATQAQASQIHGNSDAEADGGPASAAALGPEMSCIDGSELNALGSKISALQEDLAQSWGEINEWKKKLTVEHHNLTVRDQDLQNREKEIRLLSGDVDRRAQELTDQQKQYQKQETDLTAKQAELAESRTRELTDLQKRREKQEADLAARQEELEEQCAQELSDQQKRHEEHEADLTARQAELDGVKNSLDSRDAELGQHHAELTTLASNLELRQKEVDRFWAQYDAQRNELDSKRKEIESREAAVAEEHARVEEELRSARVFEERFEEKSRELADREGELSNVEAKLRGEREALATTRGEVDQRYAEIDGKRSELAAYEEKLAARYAKHVEQEAQLHNRAEVIKRFRQLLEEANEAYDITVNTPVDPIESTIPQAPESPEVPEEEMLADAAATLSSAQREMQAVVSDLRDQTQSLVDDLHDEALPKESAEDAGASAGSGQCSVEPIDLSTLEPEVRERFRALKRLGGNGKSDSELVAQIRAELAGGKSHQPKGRKKKAWWKG